MRRILPNIAIAVFLILSAELSFSQSVAVTINPEADAFVRAAAPTNNYGGAGAIAVSGPTAVNASNEQNGAFDSLIRFAVSNAVATLDSALATHDWLVLRATLKLTEMGAPPSTIFNRGAGIFEIRWIESDSWIEGTGVPLAPATNGVTWNDLVLILNSAADVSLGQFNSTGTDTRLSFPLSLRDAFLSDFRAGERVTFYLTAISPQIGFTADSRTFISSNDIPVLEIMAAANPHPRIESIEDQGTNVLLSFTTVSNWTYVVQRSEQLSETWSNLITLPAQTTNSQVIYPDPKTSSQKHYRLLLFQ